MITKEDLLLSIEKKLKEKENSLITSIESNKEHLKSGNKIGVLEKMQKKQIISSKDKELKEIHEVQRVLDSLTNEKNREIKNISPETLAELKEIVGCFSDEERKKVEDSINSDVKESNKEIISKADQKGKDAVKLIKGLNLKNKDMLVYKAETGKPNMAEPKRNVEKSMEMVSVMEIQDLEASIKDVIISEKGMEVEENHTFNVLDEMIKKGKLENGPQTEKIIKDFYTVKANVIKQRKLEELSLKSSSLLLSLENEQGIDFTKTIEIIKEVIKEYRKEIDMCKEALKGVDLEYLKEKVDKYSDEKQEKQISGEEKVYEPVKEDKTPKEEVIELTEKYETEKEISGISVYGFYTEYMIYKQKNPEVQASYLDFMKVKHPNNKEIIHLLEIKEQRDNKAAKEYLRARASGDKRTFKQFVEKEYLITKNMDSVEPIAEDKAKEEGMSR